MVCFTRWFADPPVESLRVVRLADQALPAGAGWSSPAAMWLMVRTDPAQTRLPSLGSILVKKVAVHRRRGRRRCADSPIEMGF